MTRVDSLGRSWHIVTDLISNRVINVWDNKISRNPNSSVVSSEAVALFCGLRGEWCGLRATHFSLS